MKYVITIALMLIVSTTAYAQKAEVTMDTAGPVPIVKVWDTAFVTMCKSLAERLGTPDAQMVRFKPKSLPQSRSRYAGDEWTVGLGLKEFEVKSSELPEVLQKLHGAVARNVMQITCYVKDNEFFSTEHVVIIAASDKDAQAIVAAIR